MNNAASPKSGLINVAIAISQGTTNIDWVGPEAVFQTWHEDPVTKKPAPRFKIYKVSEKTEPVSGLVPDYSFADAPAPRIVVVPAQRGSPALVQWLKDMSRSAELIMSVCTGARHLAAAGLLDGRTATTHHEAVDEFAQRYPNVKWVKGVRFVEGERICTGGGLTAGIDLALRIVERYLGRPAAQSVADHLEYQGRGWIV
jgi:transcriptional regulator GlxA family with amidase domain